MKSKQLYIVTGKGGVGKTTLALALSNLLQKNGHKVKYNCFDQVPFYKISNNLGIPVLDLNLDQSMKIYVGRKLHSETIAGMVLKAPFFKSTFSMIPGLGQMILLGHIIDILEEDPDLSIVIDSPSSGHAMTMLESMENFKNIFTSGILVKDIERMEKFIFSDNKVQVLISALPTNMAMNEAIDLKNFFCNKGVQDVSLVVNEYLYGNELVKQNFETLPDFLKKKVQNEREVLKMFENQIQFILPYIFKHSSEEIITELCDLLNLKL